jgi:hypothetical protein
MSRKRVSYAAVVVLSSTMISLVACAGEDDFSADPDAGSGGASGSGSGGRDAGTGGGGRDAGDASTGGADSGSVGGAGGGGASQGGTAGTAPEPPSCYDEFPGVLFCDNFEATGLPGWTHFGGGTDGETTQVTSGVYRGSAALRSVKSDEGPSDPLYVDVLGDRTSGRLYLRTYLYVPSDFSLAAGASLLVLGESAEPLGGLSLVLAPDAVALQINGQVSSQLKGFYVLPRNEWLCVQIDFAIAQAGSARLRIDGQLITEGTANTLMGTHYDRLWLGVNWIHPNQTETVEALYDDVVVDTEDIPCD